MRPKRNQLAYLLKAIETVTVESLPEVIALVPGYGSLINKILLKVLSNKVI